MEVISPRDGATSHCSLFLKVFTGPIAFFSVSVNFLIRLYPEVRPERLLHNHLHFIY